MKIVVAAGSVEVDRVMLALAVAQIAAGREGNEVSVSLSPWALLACKKENPTVLYSPALDVESLLGRITEFGFPATVPEWLKATKEAGLKIYACKVGAALIANAKEADLLPEIELMEPDKLVNDVLLAADKILTV